MFPTSSQRMYWMFKDEQELADLRIKSNESYVDEHSHDSDSDLYLTPTEERILLQQYESQMREFCRRFQPPMPNYVVGTSFHYFKRFYMCNSIMKYPPKEILVTCVYLAAKVEEFNISISQFVANVRGDREKAKEIILNNELSLMQELKFHLTIHNPFRCVEGLLIDIKTRYSTSLKDPEDLRQGINEFLEKSHFTDACLIYAPSQIALAAILHAASKKKQNLDAYVTDVLLGENGQDKLENLVNSVRKIRSMVRNMEMPGRDVLKPIEKKLEKCKSQFEKEN